MSAAPMSGGDAGRPSAVRIVSLYPDVMDVYADGGNLIALAARCRRRGIDFLLTPFDEGNVRLCAALRVKAVKWSSGELTNVALLARAVKVGKPVLISTGMGSVDEIARAVRAARAAGGKRLALLHCVSTYPAPPESLNLRVIQTLAERFGLPVGFSDHTLGAWAAPLARAQGAVIIEKHFTLSRKLRGPDHAMSAEPDELADYVRAVRRAETALGRCEKRVGPAERRMARLARRSVVAAADIRSGERIRASDLALKRPATGIEPAAIRKVVGRLARRSIRAGEVIRWTLLK